MPGGGAREVVVLGTSAQIPTRERNQNGYLLRWDRDAILFDPGEGTQRQLLQAGVNTGSISAIALTHLHGDHCLGLPGVLSRFVVDQRTDPIDLYAPASGIDHVERLCRAAIFDPYPNLRIHPLPATGATIEREGHRLVALPLEHSVDALGYRIEEDPHLHVEPASLAEVGVSGPDIGTLVEEGSIVRDGRRIELAEVSHTSPGQAFALVMDTAICDNAVALAADADLVLSESTFLESDGTLARDHFHLTARQAAWVATEAGARTLALTHFSARHPRTADFVAEASEVHPRVVGARDLQTIPLPAATDPES